MNYNEEQMLNSYKIVKNWNMSDEFKMKCSMIILEGETDYDRLRHYFQETPKRYILDLSSVIGEDKAVLEVSNMLRNEYSELYKSDFRNKKIDDLLNGDN